jgi:predicted NAD/FAD-binding protein
MRIAIVGSGIAGLTAAWLLARRHEVVVFESESRIGGHTATVDVRLDGRDYAIDTGFIVYNDRTYPNFIRLLAELGVNSQPTDMTFSVSHDTAGLEYAGSNLNTLFAQRANLLRPGYWRMLRDILRFNRESQQDLDENRLSPGMQLGDYLRAGGYSSEFRDWYLVPMGAAIWSSGTRAMDAFPVEFFIRFFRNHGLLAVTNRPQWRTLVGGSRSYLEPITRAFAGSMRTADPVTRIRRDQDGVDVQTRAGEAGRFDQLVLACHSDQSLSLLETPSAAEQGVLGAIAYRANDVILHNDTSVLPRRRLAWSSWNYRIRDGADELPVLSYDMNILQRIESPHTFCVTLNDSVNIDSSKILGRFRYSHPVYSVEAVSAQQRWREINGTDRTWYCGAWWGNGFHEDGVSSAVRVAQELGVQW